MKFWTIKLEFYLVDFIINGTYANGVNLVGAQGFRPLPTIIQILEASQFVKDFLIFKQRFFHFAPILVYSFSNIKLKVIGSGYE